MGRVVVDTDIVSYVFKSDSRAALYERHIVGNDLIISFQTLAELLRWPIARNWGEERQLRLREFVRMRLTVYPYTGALCERWAEVSVAADRSGRPIETGDAWVAATAVHNSLPLVTHNRSDYAGVPGLTILSEAE